MRRGRGRWPAVPLLAASLLLALGGGARLVAQDVRFPSPRGESASQRELARFVEEQRYRLLVRDTVLARDDSIPESLLVLEAAVRIAGTVRGDVYVAAGDLFLRPGARIEGDVLVVGGGYYASGMAEVEGRVTYRPNERIRVMPEEGGFLVFSPEEEREIVDLGPMYGISFPTYQRVDGWTFRWGGTLRGTGLPWRPELEGEARFRTEQENVGGTLRLHVHPARRWRLTAEGTRETRTHERWIWGDFLNTVSYLFLGDDYRDYYRADAAGLTVEASPRGGWTLAVGPRWERARSLEAHVRDVLFRSDRARPNPEVDEGETVSLVGGLELSRRQGRARSRLRVQLEGASDEVAGDFSFLLGEARVGLRRPLPAGHAIEVLGVVRGDLAGSTPRQRWSGLGGVGTLPTFPIQSLRGPRLFMVEMGYLVPIPGLEVPHIGPTEVLLRGTVGSAWGEGESIRVEQNIIGGIRFLFLEAGLAWDPGVREREFLFFIASRFPRGG